MAQRLQSVFTLLKTHLNRQANGTLTSDIYFEAATQRVSWVTPAPGGVGPITVAILLENTLYSAETLH